MSSYKQIFSESFNLLRGNKRIFIPIVFSVIFSIIFSATPYFQTLAGPQKSGDLSVPFSFQEIIPLMLIIFVFIIIGLIVNGWSLSIMNKVVNKKDYALFGEFIHGLKFVLSLIVIGFFGLLTFAAFFGLLMLFIFIIGILGFSTNPILAMLVMMIFLMLFFVLSCIFLAFFFQIIGALISEAYGPIDSIASAWNRFTSNFWHSMALFGLVAAMCLVAYIPMFILQFYFILSGMTTYIYTNPVLYQVLIIVVSLPAIFAITYAQIIYGYEFKNWD